MATLMDDRFERRGTVYHGESADTSFSSCMEGSRMVVNTITDDFLECTENILKSISSNVITIAEFGAADAGVSLPLMKKVIDFINKVSNNRLEIVFIYEDQIFNDFNILFKNLRGEDDLLAKNVHVFTSATSMYDPCSPAQSIDIVFSSMAVNWMSHRPCNIEGGIFQSDCDENELMAFKQQWASDWKAFLTCRAKELKLGGYALVITFVLDKDGSGNKHTGVDSYAIFTQIWKQFCQSERITEEEFLNTSCGTYVPNKDELLEPLKASIPGPLSLVRYTQKDVIIHDAPENSVDTTGKEVHVDKCIRYIKPWLYNILYSGLSTNRTPSDRKEILDNYFDALRTKLMQQVTFGPVLYKVAHVIAKRTK